MFGRCSNDVISRDDFGGILGIILGYSGSLLAPLFGARNGRFWVVDLQVDLQTGLAFFKNWTCKSG